MLVAWPDVVPYAGRVSRWLRLTTRRLVDRLRLAVGRPRDQVVRLPRIDHPRGTLGGVSVVVSVNPGASLEERVEYLLRREQETQDGLNAHDQSLRAIEEHVPRRLDQLRAETEEHVAGEISAAEWRYRPLRFVGGLALALGLALTTTASLL